MPTTIAGIKEKLDAQVGQKYWSRRRLVVKGYPASRHFKRDVSSNLYR